MATNIFSRQGMRIKGLNIKRRCRSICRKGKSNMKKIQLVTAVHGNEMMPTLALASIDAQQIVKSPGTSRECDLRKRI